MNVMRRPAPHGPKLHIRNKKPRIRGSNSKLALLYEHDLLRFSVHVPPISLPAKTRVVKQSLKLTKQTICAKVNGMIAVLDNIRSNHNVGSIFRTADAMGIKKIYLCGITPAPRDRFGRTNKELTKVALGAEKYCAWEHAPKTHALLDKLKQNGYTVYALEQSKKARSLRAVRRLRARQSKTALVVGNEVKGISRATLKRADCIIEIPMAGRKESLNVSVAFGIAARSGLSVK